jgi:hypothetical protein
MARLDQGNHPTQAKTTPEWPTLRINRSGRSGHNRSKARRAGHQTSAQSGRAGKSIEDDLSAVGAAPNGALSLRAQSRELRRCLLAYAPATNDKPNQESQAPTGARRRDLRLISRVAGALSNQEAPKKVLPLPKGIQDSFRGPFLISLQASGLAQARSRLVLAGQLKKSQPASLGTLSTS